MKKKVFAAALISALVISGCGDGGSGNSADKATAVEMRLQRLVGNVTLTNEKGENQSLIEKMRLASGNALATDIESLVMVSLDETKLVTMEEKSKASITAKDKALQLNLEEGNLFFNVKEKIPEGSSFEIHNGNMLCGIRGTSGYSGKDSAGHPVIMATDGEIEVTGENPVTKEKIQGTVKAGEMATIFLDDEAEGDKSVSFKTEKFKEENLPALALDSIRKDNALQSRITEATGFSGGKLEALAEAASTKAASMYGAAAEELKSKGIEDAVPLMGKSSQIMTKTALKASDTAGTNLELEISIIKGLRTTLDTGLKAEYNDNALEKLVETASDQVNKGVDQAAKAGLKDKDIITAAETMTKAINVSAEKMMDKGLSSEEVTQVVDTIGKVYEQAISTGTRAGGAEEVMKSVETAAARVDQTVETQMQQNSNGEKTATALIGNNTSGQNPGNTQPAGQTAVPAAAPAAPAATTPAQSTSENISASNDDDDDDDDYSYSSSSSTTSPTSDNKNNTSGGSGSNAIAYNVVKADGNVTLSNGSEGEYNSSTRKLFIKSAGTSPLVIPIALKTATGTSLTNIINAGDIIVTSGAGGLALKVEQSADYITWSNMLTYAYNVPVNSFSISNGQQTITRNGAIPSTPSNDTPFPLRIDVVAGNDFQHLYWFYEVLTAMGGSSPPSISPVDVYYGNYYHYKHDFLKAHGTITYSGGTISHQGDISLGMYPNGSAPEGFVITVTGQSNNYYLLKPDGNVTELP